MQYTGTLIVVSHDRNFLSGLSDRVIEFSEGKIREFPGDIDSYLDQQEVVLEIPAKKKKSNNEYKKKKEFNKKMRYLNKQNEKIEKEISKIEGEIKEFNKLLNGENQNSNNKIDYNDYNRLEDLLSAQLENWEKNQDKIAEITKDNETMDS